MCGRYYIDQEEDLAEMRQILEEVNRKFYNSEQPAALQPAALKTGEIFPTHAVPVLRPEQAAPDSRIIVDLMRWGFPQHQGKGVIINARSETAADKPTFRPAMRAGRILVPANAFFEWQHLPDGRKGRKIKLTLADEPVFYMAGLARDFPEPDEPGPALRRFVILTTAANPSVAAIHDRMPLILPRQHLRRWLLDDQAAVALLDYCLGKPLLLSETA